MECVCARVCVCGRGRMWACVCVWAYVYACMCGCVLIVIGQKWPLHAVLCQTSLLSCSQFDQPCKLKASAISGSSVMPAHWVLSPVLAGGGQQCIVRACVRASVYARLRVFAHVSCAYQFRPLSAKDLARFCICILGNGLCAGERGGVVLMLVRSSLSCRSVCCLLGCFLCVFVCNIYLFMQCCRFCVCLTCAVRPLLCVGVFIPVRAPSCCSLRHSQASWWSAVCTSAVHSDKIR